MSINTSIAFNYHIQLLSIPNREIFVQPIKRRPIYRDSFITNYGFILSFLCM